MGIIGVKNLVGIGGRNGCNLIGALNSPLHKVCTAVIFNNTLAFIGDSQYLAVKVQSIFSLILNIMNGKYRFDIAKFLASSVHCIKKNGY